MSRCVNDISLSQICQARHNGAGAASPDRADRARGGAPPADARLAVAVARRGADRRARARGASAALFHQVAEQEANPPLFYVVEWLWTRVAGTSEIALRLPSALCGIALVPVAYAIGRRLASERAGGRAGGARRGAPAARLLLAGGARVRGGRARVRGRVHVLPRRGRGPARRARVGARVGGGARLPLLRDLPDRDRGRDPARPPRPRRAAGAGGRRRGGARAAAAGARAGRRRPRRQRHGRHRPGGAREGGRDELAGGRAGRGDRRARMAGGRAARGGRGRVGRGGRRRPPAGEGRPEAAPSGVRAALCQR